MQPLDALWGTKFYTNQSHWPLLIVQPSSLLIRSNIFSELLETGKNKNLCYTFAFTWSTTNAYKSPRFSVLYGPICILISPITVSPQVAVINYQNITKGPKWFTPWIRNQIPNINVVVYSNLCLPTTKTTWGRMTLVWTLISSKYREILFTIPPTILSKVSSK
jgi:hypothetical protein